METKDLTGLLYFQQVVKLGGNADNGVSAGFFYWNTSNASGNDNANIRSQLSL